MHLRLFHAFSVEWLTVIRQISPNYRSLQIVPKTLSVYRVLTYMLTYFPDSDRSCLGFRPFWSTVVHIINTCICVLSCCFVVYNCPVAWPTLEQLVSEWIISHSFHPCWSLPVEVVFSDFFIVNGATVATWVFASESGGLATLSRCWQLSAFLCIHSWCYCHLMRVHILMTIFQINQHTTLIFFRRLLRFTWGAKCILVTAVCLSVPHCIPTLLHGPGCNLGQW